MNNSRRLQSVDSLLSAALERKEKARQSENAVASHVAETKPSHEDVLELDTEEVQKSSHSAAQVQSHFPVETDSHIALSDSSKQESKLSSPLEIPKQRELATPKPRNLATKRRVASPQTDRHKTRDGQVNVQPDVELLKEIRHFLVDHDMSMRDFFEIASRHYMEAVSRRLAEGVSSNEALNDLVTIFRTSNDIVMLYQTYTGNRWKPHDDHAAHQFNGHDVRYVEIGMLNTLLRFKGKRINSFKYFVPEIEEALAVKLGEDTVQILLKRRRQQWEEKRKG